jgi:hypothetical protein
MPALPSALAAGLLLAAIPVLEDLDLPAPTGSAALEATGASRTTAYKVKAELERTLPALLRPPGRPPAPPEAPPDLTEHHRAVVTFLFDHPGAVSGTASRRTYTERYRLFVLDLWDAHREIGPEALAEVTCVPLPTLKEWLRGERPHVATPENLSTARTPAPAQIQAVLDAWERWADKRHVRAGVRRGARRRLARRRTRSRARARTWR